MKKRKIIEFIFVFLMLLTLFLLLFNSIINESRIYDEVTYVKAGYGFLKDHDFRLDPFNPPLAREIVAIPMLFNPNIPEDPTLFWPRMTVVIITLLLACLIYIFAKKVFGLLAAIMSLILFVFEPNILANGHYATMDLIFTFFFILVLYLFMIWKKKFTYNRIIIFSIVFGLALSTKITALYFIIPSLALIYILEKKNKREAINISFWKKRMYKSALSLTVILLALWSTYFFTFEPPLGYRFDSNRPAIKFAKENSLIKIGLTQPIPLGSYISTIKQQLVYNYSGWYRKDSFVFGNLSRNGHSGLYFPLIILVKTPIPLLLLFIISLFYFRGSFRKYQTILIPFCLILFLVLISNVTLVTRYLLPIYPLMIIYSTKIINIKTKYNFQKFLFIGFVLLWYIWGTLQTFPHYISFTNEFTGGYKNGYKYVFDANWDWGQGLVDLKKYQRENNIYNLQLAYFGDLDPNSLGIKYERINDASLSETKKIEGLKFDKKHTVAISATCWYLCGYYKNPKINSVIPKEIIGGSILIFR